jgi:hypothetical protein
MIRRPEPRVNTLGALKEKCQRNGKRTAAHGIPDDPTPVRVTRKPWKRLPGVLRAAEILRALGMDRQDVVVARRRIEHLDLRIRPDARVERMLDGLEDRRGLC